MLSTFAGSKYATASPPNSGIGMMNEQMMGLPADNASNKILGQFSHDDAKTISSAWRYTFGKVVNFTGKTSTTYQIADFLPKWVVIFSNQNQIVFVLQSGWQGHIRRNHLIVMLIRFKS